MEPFGLVEGIAVPFHRPNVDTDQIVPARFIMKPRKYDYAKALFCDLRSGPTAEAAFPLDLPAHRGATIMVTGENFACGSAREQAVWALQDFGIRVLVGPGFGGIFYANCMKNGILPAIVDAQAAAALAARIERQPELRLRVDLDAERIWLREGGEIPFRIAASHKAQLQGGKDDITRTLEHEAAIAAHEEALASGARWTRPLLPEIPPPRRIPLRPADGK